MSSHGEAGEGVLRVRCPRGVAETRGRNPEINDINYDEVCGSTFWYP